MPKVIIREYDNTTAGTVEYANFAVVVPGLVETGKGTDCFDENNICLFSDATTFEEKIGKVGLGSSSKIWATVEPFQEGGNIVYKKVFTQKEIGEYYGKLYEEGTAVTEEPATGRLYRKEVQDTDPVTYKYYPYTYVEVVDSEGHEIANPYSKSKAYSVILPGNEGAAAVNVSHYGNQIAYELLGLGYPVLYKKLENVNDLSSDPYWEPLKDKANYDFRYVLTGLLDGNTAANKAIIKLVSYNNTVEKIEGQTSTTGRGDCIALVDIDPANYDPLTYTTQAAKIAKIKEAAGSYGADKYVAIFAPYVVYAGDETEVPVYQNLRFPASFHYLACAAKASENFAEWYAIAGYTRGIANRAVASTGCKLGEAAIEALQPRMAEIAAVNLIIKIQDNYYLWGNRTGHVEAKGLVASSFLNIRQLCCTLKKQIYVVCKQLTFDPNSDVLWANFCGSIRPILERMKADQGIEDYKIVKVKTDKKALLKAKVRIVPIEAVEDFDISVMLEDSLEGIKVGE